MRDTSLEEGKRFGLDDIRDLIDLYIDMLKEHYKDRLISIAIFGSTVRGEARTDSDIDMLIVVEGLSEDIGERVREVSSIKFRLKEFKSYWEGYREGKPRLISEVILTPEEVSRHPPILLDIAHEGVILYDEDRFLEGELEKVRRKLEELGARRVKGKAGWYWILKPDAKLGEVIKI
ncbi:MAG: nucleotidyltransferase domain-containing protein [Nitrososphaerota archaeon]|nr:nucleotidyltransferase domain-containing protein [Candidatus Bathyarchaeota archaeon]MCX8161520.1 nucleotidyltransferase domain-containing protein [Candidatus Bathyarchaeota archaeon]MDW8062252.1 nucleotidyltransferase domain-containing protein [Nitrososphaerota archaeon]